MQEQNRMLKIFHMLSGSSDYLKATDISARMNVSERTVKSDMDALKQYAKRHGCELLSIRGKGYTLRVEDPEKYRMATRKLEILFNNTDKEGSEGRVFRIARAIMVHSCESADSAIRLEDLADELYLSESDLKKKMPEVRELFASYKLTILSKPGRGVRVTGDELNWRLCMVELYENHFHVRVVTFNEEDYEKKFIDRGDREDVRQTALQILRQSPITLYDSLMNRLVVYINLMRNRIQEGYPIQECPWKEHPYFRDISNSAERALAQELMLALEQHQDFLYSDEETDTLALLIMMWKDWGQTGGWPELCQRMMPVSDALLQYLKETFHLPVTLVTSEWQQNLASLLASIMVQDWGGFGTCRLSGSAISKNQINVSLLAVALADAAVDFLRTTYGTAVNEYFSQMLAVLFFRLIRRAKYAYRPRRLLITCRNGREGAQLLQESLIDHFGDWWIGKVTIDQLYECRKYPVEDFDSMIGSHHRYAYRYTWPYVNVHQIMTDSDYVAVKKEIICAGYALDDAAARCSFQSLGVHKDFMTGSVRDFFQLLTYQWGANQEKKEGLYRWVQAPGHVRITGQILLLPVAFSWTETNIFEIYQFKKPLFWKNKSVKAAVFLTMDFQNDPVVLRFLEEGLRFLCDNLWNCLPALTSENLLQTVAELVRRSL